LAFSAEPHAHLLSDNTEPVPNILAIQTYSKSQEKPVEAEKANSVSPKPAKSPKPSKSPHKSRTPKSPGKSLSPKRELPALPLSSPHKPGKARLTESELQEEKIVLTEERRKKCYMWYARLAQPDREKMKQMVADLPDSCDITPQEVDALPWTSDGSLLPVKAMNELFMNPEDADGPKSNSKHVKEGKKDHKKEKLRKVKETENIQSSVEPTLSIEPKSKSIAPPPKQEMIVLTEERRKKCYMWYARLAQPDREKMKQLVVDLPDSCDITPEEVDALPWTLNGALLPVKAMNELFLNPEDAED